MKPLPSTVPHPQEAIQAALRTAIESAPWAACTGAACPVSAGKQLPFLHIHQVVLFSGQIGLLYRIASLPAASDGVWMRQPMPGQHTPEREIKVRPFVAAHSRIRRHDWATSTGSAVSALPIRLSPGPCNNPAGVQAQYASQSTSPITVRNGSPAAVLRQACSDAIKQKASNRL
jgi:hypothetical protein